LPSTSAEINLFAPVTGFGEGQAVNVSKKRTAGAVFLVQKLNLSVIRKLLILRNIEGIAYFNRQHEVTFLNATAAFFGVIA
jgi:hypothetical protein